MTRYKVGDIVRVRSDLKLNKKYYMDDGKTYDTFVIGMDKYLGKYVRITLIRMDKYAIEGSEMNWVDGMFEDALKCDVSGDTLLGFL